MRHDRDDEQLKSHKVDHGIVTVQAAFSILSYLQISNNSVRFNSRVMYSFVKEDLGGFKNRICELSKNF